MDKLTELLHKTCKENFDLPWTGSVWQWSNEFINLPPYFAFNFDADLSPYLLQPFSDLLDPSVEQIMLAGARQTGKSLYSEIATAYWCCYDPGPVIRLHDTDQAAKHFLSNRLVPILQGCDLTKKWLTQKPVLSKKRSVVTEYEVNLPHMLIKVGSHKENMLRGPSARYLEVDELSLFEDQDVFDRAVGRTDAYAGRRKILVSSTPGIEGDQFSKQLARGRLYEWAWCCPKCKQFQPWYWNKEIRTDPTTKKPVCAGIQWTPHKNADGSYDFEKTGNSARLVCFYCEHEIDDSKANRVALNSGGKYLLVRDGGNPKVRGYKWPCFVNTNITFKEMVERYLKAHIAFKYSSNKKDLVTFWQECLGEEWVPTRLFSKPKFRIEKYDPASPWPDEVFRAMAIDYQQVQRERYFVIMAFDKEGNGRLVKYGKEYSWDQIQRIQKENNVQPYNVFIDCGYDYDGVLRECSKRGEWVKNGSVEEFQSWVALKGHTADEYSHRGEKIKRYYAEPQEIDVGDGLTPAEMYLWAANSVRNIFGKIRDGKGKVKWSMNVLDQDFINQLFSEEPITKDNGKVEWQPISGKPANHYFDCMCMLTTACLIAGLPITGTEDVTPALAAAA